MAKKEILNNGVTVVTEVDNRFKSAGVVVCLKGGLVDELANKLGVTHLLEHLLFKRTSKYDRFGIAAKLDELGGEVNAVTDLDTLCIHGFVPGELVYELTEFIFELIEEANFDQNDLALEKEIIKQEILESFDDPADLLTQEFYRGSFPGSNLSTPVFGTIETVDSLTLDDCQQRRTQLWCGSRIFVTAMGGIDEQRFLSLIHNRLGQIPTGEAFIRPKVLPFFDQRSIEYRFNQLYFLGARSWPGVGSDDYLLGHLTSILLGGSNTSRLFQRLREERGLVYDISTSVESIFNVGMLISTAVTESSKGRDVIELAAYVTAELLHNGVTDAEFLRAQSMLRAVLEMEQDSLSSRLWRLVESEVLLGRNVSTAEIAERLQNMTLDEVNHFCRRQTVNSQSTAIILGDVAGVAV